MTSPDDLDITIDQVAREMTAGDASANLRARVMADIEGPRPFAWRPVFAALAVAAALVIAIVVTSRGRVAETPRQLRVEAPRAEQRRGEQARVEPARVEP